MLRVSHAQNAAGNSAVSMGDGDSSSPMCIVAQTLPGSDLATAVVERVFTNTAAQVYFELGIFSGSVSGSVLETHGWIDRRGRD
jgi:hypothetical protein